MSRAGTKTLVLPYPRKKHLPACKNLIILEGISRFKRRAYYQGEQGNMGQTSQGIDISSFDLLALDNLIDSYDYESDPVLRAHFRKIEESLWSMTEHYGEGVNEFGPQMAAHLRRTSLDGMKFMVDELGFSQRAGRNFHAANMFQDLGKIHPAYDPAIWALPNRPTEEERAEKKKHPARGVEVFAAALKGAPKELLD